MSDTETPSFGNLPVRVLNFISDKLGILLDRAIQNIDRFRENLIVRFYRAIKYIEDFIRAVLELLKVILPIIIVFVPPTGGFYSAFLLYAQFRTDAYILIALCILLLVIIFLSFFAGANPRETGQKRRKLDLAKDLEELGPIRRIIGAAIALILLGCAYYVSKGLFLGLVMFVLEFLAVVSLKYFYGTAEEPRLLESK